jgi:MFS family permease
VHRRQAFSDDDRSNVPTYTVAIGDGDRETADDAERPQVGDRLTLTSPLDGSRVRALVVGSWQPGTDGLRTLGEPSKPSLLVTAGTFEQLAARASSVRWRAAPSFHLLEPEQLDETLTAAIGTERAVAAAAESEGASMRVENPLIEVLEARGRELMAQRMLLLVPALILLLLGAAGAALVAGALSQTRRGDEWLRRSRGAGRRQVVGPTLLEATVLCGLGALGGPVVAAALVRIGGVRPALDASAWTAGAVAALICWTALVTPALAWAMTGDRGEPLSAERRRRRMLTSLLVGVMLMLALGAVAVMRLRGFASAVADTTRWSGQVDPLVVASPALLLLALVTVLALLLLPVLFRLAEHTDRMRGAALALGTRSASRAPGRAVPLALAVALVAGGVAFASVGHASQEHARQARAAYEVGADMRVTVPPASRRAGGVEEREALEGLPGVQDAAAVHRELDFVDDVAVEVLVVELDGAAGQAVAGTAEDPADSRF